MKNKKLILSIIGVAALLLVVAGTTYAYFAIRMNGTAANASVTTARVGTVSFQADEIDTTGTKVLPGWISGAKSLEIGMSASDVTADYECTLTFTSRVPDLYLKVENVSGTSANTTYSSYTQINSNSVVISSGTLAGNQTDEVNYYLQFKETGLNQNTQMGQSIVGTVSCSITSSLNYTTPVAPTTTRYYSWSSGNISRGLPSDADTDLSNINTRNKPFYLAFDSSDGETIDAAYVCFTRNNTEYCLQGGDDSAEVYTSNQDVIREAFADVASTSACLFVDGSYCDVSGLHVYAYWGGEVSADDGDSAVCRVKDFGSFSCRE